MKNGKDSKRKQQWEHVINGKDPEEKHISNRTLGGLRVRRGQGNPKSSNSFLFIFYSLSFRHL